MQSSNLWLARCKRLRDMDWDELRVRARQEVAKRWDLVLSQIGSPFVGDGECSPLSHASGRFLFSQEEVPRILACLRERLPDVVEEIVERAERICQHRFDLLGHEGVDYGAEIDWHVDAVHGRRAPRCPWFRVRYLDFNQVGDSKVIWELNRHQHLVMLAKAYRLTENEGYARELFRQWYDWQEQNPYPIGINWASSLEVALRSLSWLWIRHLLDGCAIVPDRFAFDLRRALALNARHIERFLSTYFSPNTHLLGEGVGLFFIGTLCRDLGAAHRWQECGWKIVLSAAPRQVRPDGMHFEQSVYYHIYALDFFLHSRILAALNGIPVPAGFDGIIEKMLDAICALSKTGPLPRFGDDDGGRGFDPRRNRTEHLLDPLATGAVLFSRADFKAAAGGIREETLWLFGTEGAARFDRLSPRRQRAASFALEPSGVYVMCSSKPVQQCVIDAGPQGAGWAGHGHGDALSVQLSINGEALLIDPGTFAYADPGCERNWFRGTAGHNTVQVDGLSQADPAGPFKWRALPNVGVDCWVKGKTFDLFAGSHSGYSRLASPVRHRRYVFYLRPQFWLIRDLVEGAGLHRVEVCWHFAPGSLSTIPGGITFTGETPGGLALLFAANQSCSQEIFPGWYSPVYGKKQPSPVLRLSARADLPAEFATLLIPVWTNRARPGSFQTVESGHKSAAVRAYRYSVAGLAHYVFFADKAGSWRIGPWASDARFLYFSTNSAGNFRQLVIYQGSYLEISGRRIFTSDGSPVCGECLTERSGHQFVSSEESAPTAEPSKVNGMQAACGLKPAHPRQLQLQ